MATNGRGSIKLSKRGKTAYERLHIPNHCCDTPVHPHEPCLEKGHTISVTKQTGHYRIINCSRRHISLASHTNIAETNRHTHAATFTLPPYWHTAVKLTGDKLPKFSQKENKNKKNNKEETPQWYALVRAFLRAGEVTGSTYAAVEGWFLFTVCCCYCFLLHFFTWYSFFRFCVGCLSRNPLHERRPTVCWFICSLQSWVVACARDRERERKRGIAKAILREREQDTRHWTTEPSDLEARQWPPLGHPVGRLVCCYASYREGCRIHLDDSTNRSHRCVRVNVGVCVGELRPNAIVTMMDPRCTRAHVSASNWHEHTFATETFCSDFSVGLETSKYCNVSLRSACFVCGQLSCGRETCWRELRERLRASALADTRAGERWE